MYNHVIILYWGSVSLKRAGLVTTFQTVYSAYLEEKSKFTFSTYKGCQVPFKHSHKKTRKTAKIRTSWVYLMQQNISCWVKRLRFLMITNTKYTYLSLILDSYIASYHFKGTLQHCYHWSSGILRLLEMLPGSWESWRSGVEKVKGVQSFNFLNSLGSIQCQGA